VEQKVTSAVDEGALFNKTGQQAFSLSALASVLHAQSMDSKDSMLTT
jgi:hypothetical protein